MVAQQALLPIVPLGQLQPGAERQVIVVGGRQVEIQAQAAALLRALARQRQVVEVFGDARAIRVVLVVATAVQGQVLRPTEQAFQAEQQQVAFAVAFLDALGALARSAAGDLALAGAGGRFLAVLRTGGRRPALAGIQPQRHRPGRPLDSREALDAARLGKRAAQGDFQFGVCRRAIVQRRALAQMRGDQPGVARAQRRIGIEQLPRPTLVVLGPVPQRPGAGRQQRQPAIQFAVQLGLRIDREGLRQAQAVAVEPGHRGLLAGPGDPLQPGAA